MADLKVVKVAMEIGQAVDQAAMPAEERTFMHVDTDGIQVALQELIGDLRAEISDLQERVEDLEG